MTVQTPVSKLAISQRLLLLIALLITGLCAALIEG